MEETKPMSFFFASAEPGTAMAWRPPADIYRSREGWVVKVELAGVRPEDVNVIASGSQIFISGVRRDKLVEEGCSHYSMEITYSRFERTIELPCALEQAGIQVEFHDGLLLARVITNPEESQAPPGDARKQ
ncbi:MAG: Hsp20/alpha crystallin family protein [Blastocatellales bacterium]